MHKINLFVDAHVFDKEFQGSRTFIKEIYTLLSLKPNIQLFIAAHDTVNLAKNFPNYKNIVLLKYRHRHTITRLLFEVPLMIKKHNIHYAHFQYIAPLFKKCKYIITIHDVVFIECPNQFPFFYKVIRTFLFRRAILQSDIITTVSQYSKNSIIKHLNPGSKPIHITANGVNPVFFKPYVRTEILERVKRKYAIDKYILYVSRVEPRKNHNLLLNTYLELKLYEQGFHLVLLGHVSIEVPEFDSILKKLPNEIRKFIQIHHRINNEELMDLYKGAHLFVYPSKIEGFGIPPLEAGAMKIPVICSNTSAMSEYTFFGKYHVDIDNPQKFKEQVKDILINLPGVEELENISSHISKEYSWNKPADTLYKLISGNHN